MCFLQDLKEWDPGVPDKGCDDLLEKRGEEQKNYLVERIDEEVGEEEEEDDEDDEEEYEEEYEEEEEGLFTSRKRQILEKIASIAFITYNVAFEMKSESGLVCTIPIGEFTHVCPLETPGIIHPSLTNSVYFIMFMGLASWWANGRVVSPVVFSSLCILAAIFSAGHLLCLFLYQLQRFQQFVPPSDIYARLFGITGVVRTDCARPWELAVHSGLSWPVFVNPIVLLILYFTIATLLRLWLYEPVPSPSMIVVHKASGMTPPLRDSQPDQEAAGASLKLLYRPCAEDVAALTYILLFHATEDPSTDAGSDVIRLIGSMVRAMFIKYWIYICGGMFFFVSLEGRLVTYKIIYMMLCLSCVALYQVHYHWWRRILKYFWMGVVCYTMLVTVLIYTYQFEYFPALWKNMTGLSDTQLRDLGLEQFSVSKLFAQILIPTAFLLCCILQLHYFHTDFLHLTDLDDVGIKTDNIIYSAASYQGGSVGASNPCSEKQEETEDSAQEGKMELETGPEKNKWTLVIDRLTVLILKFFDTLHRIQVLCWRLLELHIIKIVAFSIIWIVLKEVSLLNYPFIILWSFALPFPSLRPLASSICTVWTCVVIICKMIYQLDTIEPLAYSSNCTMPLLNETNIEEKLLRASVLYVSPVDPAAWVGVRKAHPVITYIKDHVSILAVLLVEITVSRHQYYYRRHNSLEPPLMATLFEGVTRKHLDQGIPSCIRYFVNNFFYKFGLEACFLMAVNTIGQRMDLYATVHGAWLLALLSHRRRKAIAEAWPKYCTFLSALITWQYLLCIGIATSTLPRWHTHLYFNTMLVKWLFIPDYALPPNPIMIIYDAMMLLLASQQMRVFEDENKAAVRLQAGDNLEVCWTLDGATFSQHNPVPDFIHSRSYLDMIKVMLFSYLFWCVLIVIFFAGTMRISLFCLGYLVGCFYFLLFGGQLLLQPVRHTIRLWDYIIAYNVMVIFMKNVLSIGACAYLSTLSYFCCWLVQAFSLVCTIKGYDSHDTVNDECELPRAEAGIIWDAICFFFLLLQRRAFLSYYFLHVVADLKASTLLACRCEFSIQYQHIPPNTSTYHQTYCTTTYHPTHRTTILFICALINLACDLLTVIRSGEYYLFESDSEDEDGEEDGEEATERRSNGKEPQKKSVFQVTDQIWLVEEVKMLTLFKLKNTMVMSSPPLTRMFYDEDLEASDRFYESQTRFLKVFFGLYNTVVARSQMLCFFVIILNHVVSASCVTLVLPILIFLWAMLSMPRPSKHFWMTTILYTEVHHCVIKYFFQFGFFPWNSEASLTYNADQPFFAPAIIGIEKKEGYVYYDLVQLLTLFFHRSILKCHGLWDDAVQGTETAQCDPNGGDKEGYGQEDEQDWICGETGSLRSSFQPSVRSSSDGGRISSCVPRCQRPTQLCFRSSRLPAPACLSGTRRRSSGLSQMSGASVLEVYRPIRQFFYNIIHPEYSPVTDVYALMFMADVVDFIVIIFGYGAFGKHSASADITSTLSEDQVPEAFLVMLLIQFGTMVVDRALYLRKTILGKCIFQVVLVFGIHFWMFFILPKVTERKFNQNLVAQVWYFVKCIYFGLSAYQIRCGYPTRILGNFLTKSYNYLNLFLFQGFRLVPFLIELRAIMDWVWTETTLSLSSWICIEDIYANIFILKCWRESEKRYPQPRGQKKKKIVKYGMGGMIVFVLICIVWFPLLFMSLVKSVAGVLNPPLDVSVSLSLGGYQPMYKMSAQQHSLKPFTPAEFNTAMQFITIHTSEDLVTADLEGNSTAVWGISPPSQDKLVEELLLNDSDITIRFYWSIRRRVPGLLPPYIRAPSGPDANPVRQLLPSEWLLLNVSLFVFINQFIHQPTSLIFLRQVRDECPQQRCDDIKIVIFSDRVSPPSLGFLAGYGIMGLYASVVLVVGKFVREFFSGISHSIMFEELPNVDRVLKLCTDIFLVRETGELQLEEDLFAKLIFLYRSPETMIKWTREKGD
uniref:Piezo type mechanosensitive ion channel component 2 n=1 Tax=Eptatretus burgeri TaxID=7764 RepID=A0A8C4Q556_EPTBU